MGFKRTCLKSPSVACFGAEECARGAADCTLCKVLQGLQGGGHFLRGRCRKKASVSYGGLYARACIAEQLTLSDA